MEGTEVIAKGRTLVLMLLPAAHDELEEHQGRLTAVAFVVVVAEVVRAFLRSRHQGCKVLWLTPYAVKQEPKPNCLNSNPPPPRPQVDLVDESGNYLQQIRPQMGGDGLR